MLWKVVGKDGVYTTGEKFRFYAPADEDDARDVLGTLILQNDEIFNECLTEYAAAEEMWESDPSYKEEYNGDFEAFESDCNDDAWYIDYFDCLWANSYRGHILMPRADHMEIVDESEDSDIEDSARPRRLRSSRVRDSRFSHTARFRRGGQMVGDNFTTARGADVDELIDYLKSLADQTYVTNIVASGKYYIDLQTQDFGGVGYVDIKNMDVRTQYHLDWRGLKKFLQKNLGQYVEFDLRDASISQNAGRKY